MSKKLLRNFLATGLCFSFLMSLVSCGENQSRTVSSKSSQVDDGAKGNDLGSYPTGLWADNQSIFEDNDWVASLTGAHLAISVCDSLRDLKLDYTELLIELGSDLRQKQHPEDFEDIIIKMDLISVDKNGILKAINTVLDPKKARCEIVGETPDKPAPNPGSKM